MPATSTTSKSLTLRHLLNLGNIALNDPQFAKIKLGNMLSKIKVTFTGLTTATVHDITNAAHFAAATIVGATFTETTDKLPAIGQVVTLRCVGGTGAGTYVMSDAGGTAVTPASSTVAGVALLSDDGTTITFPVTTTGFVLTYYPAPALALSTVNVIGAP